MRMLTEGERANVAFLTTNDVPYGALQPTRTGLEKSILDATQLFREFLGANGIHDCDRQPQGQDHKVEVAAILLADDGSVVRDGKASLYRPVTKNGDPRIWFSGLPLVAAPDEIVVAIWRERKFWVVNISRLSIEASIQEPSPLRDLIAPFIKSKTEVVDRLVDLLRGVAAKGFLRAPVLGSTAIGRLLETELGIAINSRQAPDFHGIELKSSRTSKNRTTLFAKTPDWAGSRYKRSRELLDAFGYDRDGVQKLSCTLSGKVVNSQGLSLVVREPVDQLHAVSDRPDPRVAVWELAALRHRLITKHDETFWVKAVTKVEDGWEYIKFVAADHTSKPMVEQLTPALATGVLTLDFLVREAGDKGYLFKMFPRDMGYLFPPAKQFDLTS